MTEPAAVNAPDGQTSTSRYFSLVLFIVVCFAAAAVGSFFPPGSWYDSLKRPSYAPPNWVFGPVWTVLYLMIAVAGWLVWTSDRSHGKSLAMSIFAIQLLLNALWSAIFFGLHQPGWAILEMALLWSAILMTCFTFKRHSLTAAVLFLPYLLWVSFAALLNYGFWALN